MTDLYNAIEDTLPIKNDPPCPRPNPNTPQTKPSSSFFSLPPELRDCIYSLLVRNIHTHLYNHHMPAHATQYDTITPTSRFRAGRRFIRYALVNKQVHAEFHAAYCRATVWSYHLNYCLGGGPRQYPRKEEGDARIYRFAREWHLLGSLKGQLGWRDEEAGEDYGVEICFSRGPDRTEESKGAGFRLTWRHLDADVREANGLSLEEYEEMVKRVQQAVVGNVAARVKEDGKVGLWMPGLDEVVDAFRFHKEEEGG